VRARAGNANVAAQLEARTKPPLAWADRRENENENTASSASAKDRDE
jgi:hypothetical protein